MIDKRDAGLRTRWERRPINRLGARTIASFSGR